jgi:hypothetical protein
LSYGAFLRVQIYIFLFFERPNSPIFTKKNPLETTPLPFSPDEMVPDWARELPVAITVCDQHAIILYMNQKSIDTFENSGGVTLIGKSLFDCHATRSSEIIKELLITGKNNIYTIEKNGLKKLICQVPWYIEGNIGGLVEISIQLPENMPHFIRP